MGVTAAVRRDAAAMIWRIAAVTWPYAARTYVTTAAVRRDLRH